MPPDPSTLWQRAAAFAARRHRHQLRKDGVTPYYSHLTRVALTVSNVFGCSDPIVLAAALLHDTIEDTTTDYDDLAEHFGPEVAVTVAALTKNMALPEDTREAEYLSRLVRADWRVKLVKLADLYDNLADIENFPESTRESHRRKTHAKALPILDAFAQDPPDPRLSGPIAAVRARVAPITGL